MRMCKRQIFNERSKRTFFMKIFPRERVVTVVMTGQTGRSWIDIWKSTAEVECPPIPRVILQLVSLSSHPTLSLALSRLIDLLICYDNWKLKTVFTLWHSFDKSPICNSKSLFFDFDNFKWKRG